MFTTCPTTASGCYVGERALANVGGRVLTFGGSASSTSYGDTWLWDGTDWSRPTLTKSPSPRAGYGLATLGSSAVLFGGYSCLTSNCSITDLPADTWIWDGSAWSLVPTTVSPHGRRWHSMASLPATATRPAKVVLFGGEHDGARDADTWEFDGKAWT